VVTFFSLLIEKLQRDGGIRPVAYPESTATDAGRQQRYAYWNWFTDHWNADKAVEAMEEVIGFPNDSTGDQFLTPGSSTHQTLGTSSARSRGDASRPPGNHRLPRPPRQSRTRRPIRLIYFRRTPR
jgi:hypothetical protein